MTDPVILWLRQDLRLADQPALVAACEAGPVIPLYVLDDETPGDRRPGGASRWWLHGSLSALDAALRDKGSRLILRRGRAAEVIAEVADRAGVRTVHATRHIEPWWKQAEDELGDRVALVLHDGDRLAAPGEVTAGSGKPFRIYSPYWKALRRQMPPPEPLAAPKSIPAPEHWPRSEALGKWALTPTRPDWATGFGDWQPGEAGAAAHLKRFAQLVGDYGEARNHPAEDGTSRLSPHLHWGEVSPRQVWHAVSGGGGEAEHFLGELAWRDFSGNVVEQMPDYGEANARDQFDRLKWREGKQADADLDAWRTGHTGYPIVDAGMRQLWKSGWMHNRVRMIVASFLVKHLLIDWRTGERWFWDCLVDADYGNNTVNWQWIAGTGVDSNMFPRIMAPLVQSEKFDAGDYIREWVPELTDVPDAAIHDPNEAGRRPGDYPAKIVGHREARERALAAYAEMKG